MFRPQLLALQSNVQRFVARSSIPSYQSIISRAQSNSSRPTGLIATSGLEVLTFGTPNGQKVTILLEELKQAYGKDYVYQSINIGQNIQKEPWFTKLGPNGRIPVLVDHDQNGLAIMEGAAILSYLTRHYDPQKKFTFTKDPDLSYIEQWVAWQTGGVGPMQGQANHFYRLAKERIPYPTQRYVGETERLYGVLDDALKHSDYLVGNKYTIADIASFSWVNVAQFSGLDLKQFPNLEKWWARINARPAVQKGLSIPSPPRMTNEVFGKRLEEDKEFKQQHDRLQDLLTKAKQQYDYKYASP